jgi:peptidoglycan/xylan/chitin deacetylase (PgdA/CDA1 family)
MGAGVALVDAARAGAAFVSSTPLGLLEQFRVPYASNGDVPREGIARLRSMDGDRALLWPTRASGSAVAAVVAGAERRPEVPLFARVLGDDLVEPLLAAHGSQWHRARLLRAPNGCELGSIWRSQDGSVFLPFDPDEVVNNYLRERYLEIAAGTRGRALRHAAMRAYYGARPLIPRRLQIAVRRRYARVQARSRFPRWPIETCLYDFFDLMLAILASIAQEPVPAIAPWPDGHTWALVLTHDVERAAGWGALQPVLDLERRHGVRSSWNLVAKRCYEVEPERVKELTDHGCEVGVHGLHHDGRDIASLPIWEARLPEIKAAAERWGAVGYCSPAMHRRWEWMPLVGLDYDRSYPDTDPFEPQAGGCCSWLPFFNDGLVELPVTLPQDHTAFVILRGDGARLWAEKARYLRERGGMALIDTHPDYLVDRRIFAAYEHFIAEFASDESAWRALPKEVSSWWRRRAGSTLERQGDRWQVIGPAATEARVELIERTW